MCQAEKPKTTLREKYTLPPNGRKHLKRAFCNARECYVSTRAAVAHNKHLQMLVELGRAAVWRPLISGSDPPTTVIRPLPPSSFVHMHRTSATPPSTSSESSSALCTTQTCPITAPTTTTPTRRTAMHPDVRSSRASARWAHTHPHLPPHTHTAQQKEREEKNTAPAQLSSANGRMIINVTGAHLYVYEGAYVHMYIVSYARWLWSGMP